MPSFRESNFGIRIDSKGGLTIRDLPGVMLITREIWLAGPRWSESSAPQPGYQLDPAANLEITSRWAGQPVRHAFPYPYSPTMLYVLAPFCFLPLLWGYVLWTMATLAGVVLLTHRRWAPAPWGMVVLLSPPTFACLALGQAGLLTTTALAYLLINELENDESSNRRSALLSGVTLWALTCRPPAAITAGVALLAARRWKPIAIALALTAVGAGVATPWLGVDWPREYLQLIGHYNSDDLDPAFRWAISPVTMSNLRAFLTVDLGWADATSARWSSGLWLASVIGIAGAGLAGRMSPIAALCAAIFAGLVFSPHVNLHDETQLYVVAMGVWIANRRQPTPIGTLLWASVAIAFWLAPILGPLAGVRPSALFLAKLATFVIAAIGLARARRSAPLDVCAS